MSSIPNIPLDSVTSMLGAPTVARQLANVRDKNIQEQIRGQRHLAAAAKVAQEEVDDPGNNEVQHVHDEDKRNPQNEKQHHRHPDEEQVDIVGIEIQAAIKPDTPSLSHLDISA